METIAIILAIAAALSLGAMSPGPSFIVVARLALAHSRTSGLAAAAGMGAGGFLFSLVALLGLTALLAAVPVLYLGLKTVGGTYLVVLGFRLWRGACDPLDVVRPGARGAMSMRRSFWIGLATQFSNPKTALVYASVFTAFLPDRPSLVLLVALPLVVVCIETGWYGVVAVALSAPAPRGRYLRLKAWIDRAAGAAMSLLGLKLIVEAARA